MRFALSYLKLALQHAVASSRALRRPEPNSVTSLEDTVRQYRQGLQTKLVVLYDVVFECIYRARGEGRGRAMDLGCGPGLFTLALAQQLGYESVVGIDLSETMILAARDYAGSTDAQSAVSFEKGDMTHLPQVESASCDLVCCMGGLHHLASLELVAQALCEAERVAKPSGLIVVLDYVRYGSDETIDGYRDLIGAELLSLGFEDLFDDFGHSLHAAWTTDEMSASVPKETSRRWFHLVPPLLPPFQLVVGVPIKQDRLLLRRRPANDQTPFGASKLFPTDWALTSLLLAMTRKRPL